MITVLELDNTTGTRFHDSAFPWQPQLFYWQNITIPEPYQAGDAELPNTEDRGWPQTTTLWHPHLNVERTNPEWAPRYRGRQA